MGVAVLHPQDCLKASFSNEALIISPHMRRPSGNPNPKQSHRGKRSPTGTAGSPPRRTMVAKSPMKNFVMGQVRILKRGEVLNQTASDRAPEAANIKNHEDSVDLVLSSTDRLGPDPDMMPKQIRLTELNPETGFFAGSAFIASPPPSSLPLPGFFTKKCLCAERRCYD